MVANLSAADDVAQSVRQSIQSIETTNAKTLKLLRAVLGFQFERDGQSSAEESKLSRQKDGLRSAAAAPPIARSKRPRERHAPKFTILEQPNKPAVQLTKLERKRLATDTFNTTLKNLSKAAKCKNGRDTTLPKTPCALPAVHSGSPLQNRSPNRGDVGRPGGKCTQYRTKAQSEEDGAVSTAADCAILALECLRVHRVVDAKNDAEPPEPQLEQGALMLLDKLITLGLESRAFRAAAGIKLSLERTGGQSDAIESTVCRLEERDRDSYSVSELLSIAVDPRRQQHLDIALALQSQIMRLALLVGRGSINSGLLKAMQLDNPEGPIGLLMQGVESNWISPVKASQRLRALSQAIMNLCVASTGEPECVLTQDLLLSLRCQALEIRAHAMLMSHEDEQSCLEILSHFGRAVRRYQHQSRNISSDAYETVCSRLEALRTVLSPEPSFPTPSTVREILSDLAERANRPDDAINHLEAIVSESACETNLNAVICRCRLAALRLDRWYLSPTIACATVVQAIQALDWTTGAHTACDADLLLSGARLRKAAMTVLQSNGADVVPHISDQEKADLRVCSMKAVYSFQSFLVRHISALHLGSIREAKVAGKADDHSTQLVLLKTAHCVLEVSRMEWAGADLLWSHVDRSLQDTLTVARILDEQIPHAAVQASDVAAKPNLFSQVSHSYWYWHTKLSDGRNAFAAPLDLLVNAIDAMNQRPYEEQVQAELPGKCERCAALYAQQGGRDKAITYLHMAIKLLIETGALNAAVEITLSKPWHHVWSSSMSDVRLLGQCLISFVRTGSSVRTAEDVPSCFFDDVTLPPMHRAVLLQTQILEASRHELDNEHHDALINTSKELESIYHDPRHGVLWLQFGCELLASASKKNESLSLQLLGSLSSVILHNTAINESYFLDNYADSMRTRFAIQWSLQLGTVDMKLLQNIVDEYAESLSSALLHSSPDAGIDNPEALCRSLRSLADLAQMLDAQALQLRTLKALSETLATGQLDDASVVLQEYSHNAIAYTHLGAVQEAGRSLSLARDVLERSGVSESPYLLSLAQADYFLSIRDYERSVTALKCAGRTYVQPAKDGDEQDKPSSLKSDVLLGRAITIASQLNFHSGALQAAVAEAKRAVKLTSNLWKKIEKQASVRSGSNEGKSLEHSVQTITLDVSSPSIDKAVIRSNISPKGAPFWNAINLHIESLLHTCTLSAHCGMYPDALYYAQQAQRIASHATAPRLLLRCNLVHALLQCRGGEAQPSSVLERFVAEVAILTPNPDQVELYILLVQLYLVNDHVTKARDIIHAARAILVKLGPTSWSTVDDCLSSSTSKPSTKKSTSRIPQYATKNLSRQAISTSIGRNTKNFDLRNAALADCLHLLEGQVLLTLGEQGGAFVARTQPENLVPLLDSVDTALLLGSFGLRNALHAFSENPVQCILEETAVGLPSCNYSLLNRKATDSPPRPKPSSSAKRLNRGSKVATRNPCGPPSGHLTDAQEALAKAYTALSSDTMAKVTLAAPSTLHRRQKLLSKVMMLASASGVDLSCTSADVVSQAFLSKDHMRQRERWVLEAEGAAISKAQVYSWPMMDHQDTAGSAELQGEPEFLPNLPATWAVLSLSLSIDKAELTLSRLASQSEPFTLRIPLLRSANDDIDQHHLSYHDASEEMAEIIAQANTTAHDTRSRADRQSRKAWWAERQEIDKRIEELLGRIEALWLGGFRGILSSQKVDRDLLGRFATTLDQSLNKHLPSRKLSQGSHPPSIRLHNQVVELFVALGHPDEQDLDDCLMDLLYFVVDVLQLNGERNAYDEIDFDMLLLEVIDALRSYHDACVKTSDESQGHIILVLDKELHCFPWESLPCMENCSASRIPSLQELKARLGRMKQQGMASNCHVVSKDSGSLVLNPSSDLSSTQETFASCFRDQLPSFTSIVNRIPNEAEFRSCLQMHEIFMYFGHGSGAQYIRGRTIKSLDACAVALLMGCSSAKVIECGDYEPYGVPWNYMFAGAPAVVGTLWDVTDKDIDRFAASVLSNWGLLQNVPEQEAVKSSRARNKTRRDEQCRSVSPDLRKGKMTLDEAVARARRACTLRYLNGAAPVMYGVPVAVR